MKSDTRSRAPELAVVIYPAAEGGYTAECPDIPGCVSEGETLQETERNIRMAIDDCLSVMFEDFLTGIRPQRASIQSGKNFQMETVQVELPKVSAGI